MVAHRAGPLTNRTGASGPGLESGPVARRHFIAVDAIPIIVGTAGTSYLVRRRLPGERAFTLLGVTGQKRFVDETIPAGMRQVEYTVQGQRGKRTGALSQIFFVSIGQGDAAGEKVEGASANTNGQLGAVQHASAQGEGIVMGRGKSWVLRHQQLASDSV